MMPRLMQVGVFLLLSACGSFAAPLPLSRERSTADVQYEGGGALSIPRGRWHFLPGSGVRRPMALVTEKAGRIWLVDVSTGRKQPVAGAPRVLFGGQGGLLDVVAVADLRRDQIIYLTYSEPSSERRQRTRARRRSWSRDPSGARLDGLQVIWRDPAGGDGGQFGAIIAFAPDGRSLFLTSGERQRFTPAQDPSQPLGKILHLTLDGKPAPGNPWAGRLGAPSVAVTDPPEDTEAAKHAEDGVSWPGPNLTPAETWTWAIAIPRSRLRAGRAAVGNRNGAARRRRAQPHPAGQELRLAASSPKARTTTDVTIPPIRRIPSFEAPKLCWTPSISPTSLLIYTGDLFPEWKGSGLHRRACRARRWCVSTFNGDQARKADQWDMGARIRFGGAGAGRRGLFARRRDGRAAAEADARPR